MKKPPRKFSPFIAAAALVLASASASAQESDTTATTTTSSSSTSASTSFASGGPFGAAQQWVYSISHPNEFPFRLTKTGGSDWGYAIRPSADYFIVRNVSVGGIVSLAGGGGVADIGIGVRAGFNLRLSDLVSFWPRGGIFYQHYSPNEGASANNTQLDVTAPFLFHLVPHFFLGVGPVFSLPIRRTDGGSDATFGLTAIVGGWF